MNLTNEKYEALFTPWKIRNVEIKNRIVMCPMGGTSLFGWFELGEKLIAEGAKEYIIDDAELERVKNDYPVVWKNPDATPKLCFVGCPHLSLEQLKDWTVKVEDGLRASGKKKVVIPTVFTAAPKVLEAFGKTEYAERLKATGVITSYICPLMYMNNPLCKKMPVVDCLGDEFLEYVKDGMKITVKADGIVEVE